MQAFANGSCVAIACPWLARAVFIVCVYMCTLQALKRKPDLFMCSSLDVKAVFHCGE